MDLKSPASTNIINIRFEPDHDLIGPTGGIRGKGGAVCSTQEGAPIPVSDGHIVRRACSSKVSEV